MSIKYNFEEGNTVRTHGSDGLSATIIGRKRIFKNEDGHMNIVKKYKIQFDGNNEIIREVDEDEIYKPLPTTKGGKSFRNKSKKSIKRTTRRRRKTNRRP